MSDPDLALVRSLQAGNDGALDALMERHQQRIFRFILRYMPNEADAIELAQETFVKAYFHIGTFKPDALFSTWLFRIAINLCRDRSRGRAWKQALRTDSLAAQKAGEPDIPDRDLVSSGPDPAMQAIRNEELRAVHRAIGNLPHGLKAPLILTALEGLSHQEAGDRLGITAKAVEVRVRRARQSLLRMLAP